ncbi:hypothetical protein PCANC_25231 [Puccinia coronata f. sp. avenae]|uniref:Uncharacterized protein n=1 Tax=Puccinia coronata f. sp. avenae TaxID=200324 RepID=A0A2N5TPE3_9BASI|nr:hypothetical protein PCANC_25231 [Puccinia coronata f. sp. avenae]
MENGSDSPNPQPIHEKIIHHLVLIEKAVAGVDERIHASCYHGALRELYEYESYAVKEVLREVSPVNRNAFFEALDRRIVGHPHYKILQAQLLRLRMKRYRVQALVVGLERRKQSGSKGGGESVIGPVA